MLHEIKNATTHYFKDDHGLKQGEYKAFSLGRMTGHGYLIDDKRNGVWYTWYPEGPLRGMYTFRDDIRHGEWKEWHDSGGLVYHWYYENGLLIHDFIESPLSDEEKILLVLKYGAPMLPKED